MKRSWKKKEFLYLKQTLSLCLCDVSKCDHFFFRLATVKSVVECLFLMICNHKHESQKLTARAIQNEWLWARPRDNITLCGDVIFMRPLTSSIFHKNMNKYVFINTNFSNKGIKKFLYSFCITSCAFYVFRMPPSIAIPKNMNKCMFINTNFGN